MASNKVKFGSRSEDFRATEQSKSEAFFTQTLSVYIPLCQHPGEKRGFLLFVFFVFWQKSSKDFQKSCVLKNISQGGHSLVINL